MGMDRSILPSADPSTVWLADLIEATEVVAASAEPCDPAIVKAFSHRLELRADVRPSIVPQEANQDTYLVLDDFGGRLGRAWRETDEEDTDRETLIRDLMEGQYSHPTRIVAFNTAEGWSRDVTMDIADELRRRFAEYDEVPVSVQEFLETASRAR